MLPTLPINNNAPFIDAKRSLANHTARIFNAGMYTTAAPIPIRNFPAIIRLKLLLVAENELNTEPAAINKMNIVAALRGPNLSVRMPEGIIISVYAYRYAEANSATDAVPTS